MLLEICKCIGIIQCFDFPVTWCPGYLPQSFLRPQWCGSLLVPHSFIEFHALCYSTNTIDVICMSVTFVLFQLPTILSIFNSVPIMGTMPLMKSLILFHCLLQKIKQSNVLPLVEQWEEYMGPNHSKFASIEEDRFPAGIRMLSALEKVGSSYLKKEFRRDYRKFLEDCVNCVLSTVATRSVIDQGLSCFCPPILVGGDDHSPMQLFDMLLDGLLEKGCVRGAEMEACKLKYHSFVQEQRQRERNTSRSRPEVGNVVTFCSSQGGFRVCINFVSSRKR